ncbi:MAG: ATP-binding cassette domain-containing protein [Sporolactobacillus sp.]|nr:ATP-binding cassette domain-containing protein [Sporolactobacillus sp.]
MLQRVRVDHLEVAFNGKEVLHDLSIQVSAGEMLAVIGPNGAGKSTLLRAILGLIRPQSGMVDVAAAGRKPVIGYVPQSRPIDEEMPISARDFISLGQADGHLPWLLRRERRELHAVMVFTDTLRLADKPVGRLSGGERQRVFLAQALVRRPNVLLLDESTANLDPAAQEKMMKLVRRTAEDRGTAVIFISHDLDLVRSYADRVLLIARGFYRIGDVASLLNDRDLLKCAFESLHSDRAVHRDRITAADGGYSLDSR